MQKHAIVTGATSGIGKACAKALAERGFQVHGVGRRLDLLNEIAQQNGISTYPVDMRDIAAIKNFTRDLLSQLNSLEIESLLLINNAGLAKGLAPFQDSNFDDNSDVLMTNVLGLMEITRLLLPKLLDVPSAHIVNLGSVAGRWSYPKGAVYCASKAAVHAFSESLRMDLLGSKVRLTEILPGMVNTEFSEVRLGDRKRADAVYQGMTPLTATDIAEAILWAIERPKHVNIQEIVMYPTDQASVSLVHRK